MKRNPRRKLVRTVAAVAVLVTAIVGVRIIYITRPGFGLPYIAQFAANGEDHWTALGGTWEVADGAIRNDSNDRGAKILTGSAHWKDYVVEGDLQLLGAGSVGLISRVSEAEVGENSFKGYFAGIRAVDNSLVLGAFDFAYHEASRIRLPDPVRPFRWYHVRLKAEACQITASVRADGIGEIRTAPLNDSDCFRSGTAGLRSNGTGGVWRNVRVTRADAPPETARAFPASRVSIQRISPQTGTPPAQPIVSLQLLAPVGSPVATVRGAVVLTRPSMYVEDATSGVEIQTDGTTPVKIGDEVEVTGEVSLDRYSPVMRNARVRVLGEAVPLSPLVLSVNQVASSSYDGRFVQVEAYLRTISTGRDGSVTMDLESGAQSFHGIAPPGRSRSHLESLVPKSRLRLRGVVAVDSRFNQPADPFVVLVRSAEDVDVVAGPPWWRPSTLILTSLVVLGLIFTFNHLYLLVKHSRLRAVADERERLAHEIHDTLAQSFAGIGFQLQAIRNSLPRDAKLLEREVDRAMSMARTSHEEARRSIATLRPESLGHMGLIPALRECAERMVKNGKVTVETQGEDGSRDVPLHVKDTLFRIGQEAIANSIRHADPATIRIRLQQQRASVFLSVEDDGGGFVADSDHAGFGLLGMRKRAESISATLVIKSAPGSGTQVEVRAAVGSRFRSLARNGRS